MDVWPSGEHRLPQLRAAPLGISSQTHSVGLLVFLSFLLLLPGTLVGGRQQQGEGVLEPLAGLGTESCWPVSGHLPLSLLNPRVWLWAPCLGLHGQLMLEFLQMVLFITCSVLS